MVKVDMVNSLIDSFLTLAVIIIYCVEKHPKTTTTHRVLLFGYLRPMECQNLAGVFFHPHSGMSDA